MNIAFTDRYVDPAAKEAAVTQNVEHMMFLFWWDNIPQEVRAMRQPWMDDAAEAIEEWIADHPHATFAEVSDFMSGLVRATDSMYKDNTNGS